MTFSYEIKKLKQGYSYIIGCDEVGRGCLAGPVVAAAVILDLRCDIEDLSDVRDSKLLAPKKREELSEIIKQNAMWSIGLVSQEVVDEINIHNASLLAMKKAVEGLLYGVIPRSASDEGSHLSYEGDSSHKTLGYPAQNDAKKIALAVDGKFKVPNIELPQQAIIGGDNKVLSIAAASIVAKVYRDQLMRKLHQDYPIYNFARHKGYATLYHRKMIIQNGLSAIHRKTFCENLKAT